MIFSSALGIVGLCYSIVILCLYFWKKKANIEGRLTTLLFKILVVSLAIIGFIEIGCIWSIVTINQHPILTEVVCRLHILADIVWMTIVLVYIYVVTVDSNIIGAYVKTRRILGIVLIIFDSLVYILSCALNVTFHSAVNPNYLVIGGPALYPVYVLGGIGSIAILIMMLKYRKTKPKELNLPIIFFGISFIVITGLEFIFFNYRVNYIYFLYVYLLIAMYFTVESQDTRLLSQAEESRQEAEKANQAKSDFLSSISHEIRTPMNTILGFSQAMLEEKHLTEDIVKRDTKDIKEASADLLELINNILDISRIESGKETVDLKEYKIEDLLFEVNSVIVSKVSRDVLDFKINVDGNIPTKYKGDSDKLFKILVNILANAISHTKFGSVSLDVGGAYVGETFKLSLIIANTGHEMTESEFNRSFEDFSEEGSTIGTDSIKLGLIVAKRLIEMLGGSIDFRNEKGKGTRYLISIDQDVIDDMKIGAVSIDNSNVVEKKLLDLTGKKALIVDDNAVNVKLAMRLLGQFNLELSSASNGRDCIDLVKRNHYDIIFLDHMMPELDGIATVHILRDDGCALPIIALTANSYSGSRDRYVSEGFTDYLAKPFKYKDLHKILEKYLNN